MDEDTSTQVIVDPQTDRLAPVSASVWDMDPEAFKTALEIRKTNRRILIDWVRDTLVYGEDYGRIHIVSKKVCPNYNNDCTDEAHFSRRPSLFKPGAEKILAYMGITPTWPALSEYQQRVMGGQELNEILLECRGVLNNLVVAVGAGARDPGKDTTRDGFRDLNKTIKMVKKSSMIDMVLTLGFSEVFTQDLEDMVGGEVSEDQKQRATAIRDLTKELDRMFPPHGADGVAGLRYHGRLLLGLTPKQLKDLAEWLAVYKRHQKELADCEAAGITNEQVVALYQGHKMQDPEIASRTSLFDFNETLRLHCSIVNAAKVMDRKAVEAIKNDFLAKFGSDNLEALDNLQLVQIRTALVVAYKEATGK